MYVKFTVCVIFSTTAFEELSTLLSLIESILNSRPLYLISNDPNDLSALTPARFLIGALSSGVAIGHNICDLFVTKRPIAIFAIGLSETAKAAKMVCSQAKPKNW